MSQQRFLDRWRFNQNQEQQIEGQVLLFEAISALPDSAAVLDEKAPWALEFSRPTPEISHTVESETVEVTPLRPDSPFSFRVTPNLTYGELCLNQEARRFTNQSQCDIATELCIFAQRARDHFPNTTCTITSGHRPPAINASIGGASQSEHLYRSGEGAIDFVLNGVAIQTVENWVAANWPFSVGLGARNGFTHLGIRAGRPRVRWNY